MRIDTAASTADVWHGGTAAGPVLDYEFTCLRACARARARTHARTHARTCRSERTTASPTGLFHDMDDLSGGEIAVIVGSVFGGPDTHARTHARTHMPVTCSSLFQRDLATMHTHMCTFMHAGQGCFYLARSAPASSWRLECGGGGRPAPCPHLCRSPRIAHMHPRTRLHPWTCRCCQSWRASRRLVLSSRPRPRWPMFF